MQHGVQHDADDSDAEGQVLRVLIGECRVQHERTEQRGPRPQDDDTAPMAVSHFHQPVVEMTLVGRGQALPTGRAAHDREERVEDRHAQDQQRNGKWGEEEVRRADRFLADFDSAPDDARRHRHQQSEQQRTTVAHEDARRVEVVREEPEADARCHHCEQRPHVGRVEQIEIRQPLAVEEEGDRADADDAGGEAVEAVDEVDRLTHPDQPEHRDERAQRLVEEDRPFVERQAEGEHLDAEVHEHHSGQHGAEDLGGRGDVAHVVDQSDDEDDRRSDEHPPRLGVALEDHIE